MKKECMECGCREETHPIPECKELIKLFEEYEIESAPSRKKVCFDCKKEKTECSHFVFKVSFHDFMVWLIKRSAENKS